MATGTSQKHDDFPSQPIDEKPVSDLPGIGKALGRKLEENGLTKAYMVLGKFVAFRKNRKDFMKWLEEICGANKKQQEKCCDGLEEWCNNFP